MRIGGQLYGKPSQGIWLNETYLEILKCGADEGLDGFSVLELTFHLPDADGTVQSGITHPEDVTWPASAARLWNHLISVVLGLIRHQAHVKSLLWWLYKRLMAYQP